MPERKTQTNFLRGLFFIALFMCAVIIGALLKISVSVILPLTIAILISLVFEPILSILNNKFKIPWVVGIILVIISMGIILYFVGSLLFSSLRTILSSYPKYEARFTDIYIAIAEIFDLPFDENNSLFENLWGQLGIRSQIQSWAVSLSTSFFDVLKTISVVLFFIVFFLLEIRSFRQKAEAAFENRFSGKISSMLNDLISQITRYLSVKFFISLLTGILVYFGSLIIGLDFPILWGFISFVLNFIPTFGSIIAGVLASVFALVQFWPAPGPVIATVSLVLGVNMVLGNLVEPKIQGKNLGLSPFVIIASLSLWGWLWGFAGLVLAVPMMVILKIICEHVSILYPLSVLMGNFPITPKKKSNDTDENEQYSSKLPQDTDTHENT